MDSSEEIEQKANIAQWLLHNHDNLRQEYNKLLKENKTLREELEECLSELKLLDPKRISNEQ